jgi:hypothetical protein
MKLLANRLSPQAGEGITEAPSPTCGRGCPAGAGEGQWAVLRQGGIGQHAVTISPQPGSLYRSPKIGKQIIRLIADVFLAL